MTAWLPAEVGEVVAEMAEVAEVVAVSDKLFLAVAVPLLETLVVGVPRTFPVGENAVTTNSLPATDQE